LGIFIIFLSFAIFRPSLGIFIIILIIWFTTRSTFPSIISTSIDSIRWTSIFRWWTTFFSYIWS
jgi:hypothetical protein